MDEIELPKICFTCRHFIQHYIWRGELCMINYGRCRKKNYKGRKPAMKACGDWAEQSPEHQKYYLAPIPHTLILRERRAKTDPAPPT